MKRFVFSVLAAWSVAHFAHAQQANPSPSIAEQLKSKAIPIQCDELGTCKHPSKGLKWPPSDPKCWVDACPRLPVSKVQQIMKNSTDVNVRIDPNGMAKTYVGNTLVSTGAVVIPRLDIGKDEIKGVPAITLKQNDKVLMHYIMVSGKDTK